PAIDIWTQLNDFPAGFAEREGAIAYTLGGVAYVGTGSNNDGYEKDLWEYDAATDSWTQFNDFPTGFQVRSNAIAFTLGGVAYVGTGFSAAVFKKDLWESPDPTATYLLSVDPSGEGAWIDLPDNSLLIDADNDTKIQVEESPDEDRIRFNVAGSQVMQIDNMGNVGIGTDTPGQRLEVQGGHVALHKNYDLRFLRDDGTDAGRIGAYFEGLTLFENRGGTTTRLNISEPNDVIEVLHNSTSRFRINADGKIGIGRTATTNLLEVEGAASKSSAGDWLANSDARLKTNIQLLNSEQTLQKLMTLRGITYEWNDHQTGTKRPEGIQYGFTAQNIRQVFPELVEEDARGFLQTAYGTYDAMYVEALRALVEENKNLRSKIAELERKAASIATIEQRLTQLETALKPADNTGAATLIK
ncbi:MAG: tail fiber domain-containing protein, partial [Saprospiraceae bacterium]|nr:tail fiber domain-containing protein [Saprospiraceae bacterium]